MLPNTLQLRTSDARQPIIDALVALHTRTVDTEAGYEKMLEKAEPEFRPVVEGFHDLHSAHAARIAGMLAEKGYMVDGDGSMMGAINRTVVAVRSFFDEIDADTMTAIRNGEEHVLTAFGEALMQPLPQEDVVQLGAMRDELIALLGRSPDAVATSGPTV